MSEAYCKGFLEVARQWMCEGYYLDMRYIAMMKEGASTLYAASLTFRPRPHVADVQFDLEVGSIKAGQVQFGAGPLALQVLELACAGRISAHGQELALAAPDGLSYYSESGWVERPETELHLQVLGENPSTWSAKAVLDMDIALRRATPPFDGLADLSKWLELQNPGNSGSQSRIDIRITPPVDLDGPVVLAAGMLSAKFLALQSCDLRPFGLGVRIVPGTGLSRYQVADKVVWSAPSNGLRRGVLRFPHERADIAQLMLTYGNHTVRKHVLVDADRARTVRLAAVTSLDPGLAQLHDALRPDRERDAARFERAVATLAYLHGFAPTPLADTDGPDLLVSTPGGRLVIVESTLKVNDVAKKAGNLIARRNRLVESLEASGHFADVHTVLVCASRREDMIGVNLHELAGQNVTLVAGAELQRALDNVQNPEDPDLVLARAKDALVATQRHTHGLTM